jgi:serine/threonine protein kinase
MKQVGFGGTGKVFKVINTKTKEIRGLKAITNMDPSNNSQFASEIQIGMQLSKICPYLVRYYSIFEEGDFQIIIMEFFEETYLTKIKNLKEEVFLLFLIFYLDWNIKDIIRLSFQIATALRTLHERNIIHRDLKISNILVTKDGNFKLSLLLYVLFSLIN